MTMFRRHCKHIPSMLLAQSFGSLSTILLSPTTRKIQDYHSRQLSRQTSIPSLTMLCSIYTSQSRGGLQEVAYPLPPQPQFDKRVPQLHRWIDIPQLRKGMGSKFDEGEYEETHNISALKLHFFEHIRPFLVSRCVLLTRPLHDSWVKILHLMNSNLTGNIPVYVTSLDLLRCLSNLQSIYWTHLLNMLVRDRVMVVEDWEHSLASIEWMLYGCGMHFTSKIGDDHSMDCRAEYAASFDVKSRTATIASIIWKSKRIVDCQINHGISCSNYGEAQGIALYYVLKRGRQLGHWNIDIVTNVALHDKILKGTHDIEKTPYPRICMAILQAAKQYKICQSRLKPREMLGLVIDMAESKNMEHFELQAMLEAKVSHLIEGIPIFHITQKKNKIMSKLGKCVVPGSENCSPKVTFQNSYHIEVPDKSMKLDALAGILSVLEANSVIVLTGSSESASEVQSIMEFSHECCVIDNTRNVDIECQSLTSKYSAMILIDHFEIPPVKAEKVLVIVFDTPKGPLSVNHTHSNALLVNIVTPNEKACISNSEEVNPMLYGFFRCCGGTK